jgi:N-glycosylase/DNA lyase
MMPNWDAATWTAVGVIITGVLSLFFTKGAQAWIMVAQYYEEARVRKLQSDILEDEQLEHGYKYIIKKQDSRITELERLTKILQQEHRLCHESLARIEERYKALREVMDMNKQIDDATDP